LFEYLGMHVVLHVKERNVAQPEDPSARSSTCDGAFQRLVIIDRSRAEAVRHDADGSIRALTVAFLIHWPNGAASKTRKPFAPR